MADTSSKIPQDVPSPALQTLIEHALGPRITCDMPPAIHDSQQRKAEEALFDSTEFKLWETANKNLDEPSFLPWSVPALGVQFDKVFIWWKATMAWSRLARVEELSKALQEKGFHPIPHDEFDEEWDNFPKSVKKWGVERLTPSWHWKIFLVEGLLPFGDGLPTPGGVSLLCRVDEAKDDAVLAKLGLPSSKNLEQSLFKKEEIPSQWVEEILKTKNEDLYPILARYYTFTADQVENFLNDEIFQIDKALINNKQIILDEQHLNTLMQRRWKQHLFGSLFRSRWADLSAEQKSTICTTEDMQADCKKLK